MERTAYEIGAHGESIAVKYLQSKGFTVLERNYRQKWGEIDIVCRKGRSVRFVEVKSIAYNSRRELERDVSYGTYSINERIDQKKLKNLHQVIQTYCAERGFKGYSLIDALFVYLVPCETYAAVEFIEDIGGEILKGDDWHDFT